MSETKRTPGPWEAWPEPDERGEPTGSWLISQAARHEDIAMVTANRDIPPQVAEANARLIAASPCLLAACERALEWVEYHGLTALEDAAYPRRPDLLKLPDLLRAALARARGE